MMPGWHQAISLQRMLGIGRLPTCKLQHLQLDFGELFQLFQPSLWLQPREDGPSQESLAANAKNLRRKAF